MSAPRPKLCPMLHNETIQPTPRCSLFVPSDVRLKRSPVWEVLVALLACSPGAQTSLIGLISIRLGCCFSDIASDGSGAGAAIVPSFGRTMHSLEIIYGGTSADLSWHVCLAFCVAGSLLTTFCT